MSAFFCWFWPLLFGAIAALLGWLLRCLWGQGKILALEGEVSNQKKSYATLKTDYDGFSTKYNTLSANYNTIEQEKLDLHHEWETELTGLNLKWENKYNGLHGKLKIAEEEKLSLHNEWQSELTALNLKWENKYNGCLLYTSPSPRDATLSRMPSSA